MVRLGILLANIKGFARSWQALPGGILLAQFSGKRIEARRSGRAYGLTCDQNLDVDASK
jgi:hypothetical protein